jgi:hypothetical protein
MASRVERRRLLVVEQLLRRVAAGIDFCKYARLYDRRPRQPLS